MDESALEMDIEEIEDEDINVEELSSEESNPVNKEIPSKFMGQDSSPTNSRGKAFIISLGALPKSHRNLSWASL